MTVISLLLQNYGNPYTSALGIESWWHLCVSG